MRLITKTLAILAVASSAALAGCTSQTGGDGGPTGQGQPTTGASDSAQDLHGAPKVSHPLDTAKFQSAMCTVLTAQQLSSLGISATGATDDGQSGPACVWNESTGNHMQLRVEAGTDYPYGLATYYEKHEKGQLAVFQPLGEIAGYPAVRADLDDGTSIGHCTIYVGVSDKLAYMISQGSNINKTDPCGRTKQIAQAVVQTLKGNS